MTRLDPSLTAEISDAEILQGGSLRAGIFRGFVDATLGPEVQYFYMAGEAVSVHAACDVGWQQEKK